MYYKAIKTKLKLNNYQATLMAKHAGFSRWVYNWGLRLWSEGYKEGLKASANTLKKLFTNHVKPQFSWMSELSSKVYQYIDNGARLGWLIDQKNKRVEIYPQGQDVEILQSPTTLLGQDVLPGFVLDLNGIL
jgi:transposase